MSVSEFRQENPPTHVDRRFREETIRNAQNSVFEGGCSEIFEVNFLLIGWHFNQDGATTCSDIEFSHRLFLSANSICRAVTSNARFFISHAENEYCQLLKSLISPPKGSWLNLSRLDGQENANRTETWAEE